jgi:hypothetical protein
MEYDKGHLNDSMHGPRPDTARSSRTGRRTRRARVAMGGVVI